jgi:hypothetical protein
VYANVVTEAGTTTGAAKQLRFGLGRILTIALEVRERLIPWRVHSSVNLLGTMFFLSELSAHKFLYIHSETMAPDLPSVHMSTHGFGKMYKYSKSTFELVNGELHNTLIIIAKSTPRSEHKYYSRNFGQLMNLLGHASVFNFVLLLHTAYYVFIL